MLDRIARALELRGYKVEYHGEGLLAWRPEDPLSPKMYIEAADRYSEEASLAAAKRAPPGATPVLVVAGGEYPEVGAGGTRILHVSVIEAAVSTVLSWLKGMVERRTAVKVVPSFFEVTSMKRKYGLVEAMPVYHPIEIFEATIVVLHKPKGKILFKPERRKMQVRLGCEPVTGNPVYYREGEGLTVVYGISRLGNDEKRLYRLAGKWVTPAAVAAKAGFNEQAATAILEKLVAAGLAESRQVKGGKEYMVKVPLGRLVSRSPAALLPVEEANTPVPVLVYEKRSMCGPGISGLVKSPNLVEVIYYPVLVGVDEAGKLRTVDLRTGKENNLAKAYLSLSMAG